MWAQVAALKTGERRVKEICEKHGKDTVLSAIDSQLDHGETISRQELAKLPKGTYTAEGFVETDGIGNGPFPIQVEVTVTDNELFAILEAAVHKFPALSIVRIQDSHLLLEPFSWQLQTLIKM